MPPKTVALTLEKPVVIGGVVVDQYGKPLAGAKVMIVASKKNGDESQLIRGYETVTADEAGQWEFDKLPGKVDEIELSAMHPECLGEYGFFLLQPYKDVAALRAKTAKLTLLRGVPVLGTIVDPQGQP